MPKAAVEAQSKTPGTVVLKPARGEKEEFSILVDWPMGESVWKDTSSEVQDVAAIKKYKLYEYNGYWKYVLHFENTLHYDYQFKDESNDVYMCDTWENGDHYVRYDSEKPAIKKIMGR